MHPPTARDHADPHRATRRVLWIVLAMLVVGAVIAKVTADRRYSAALHHQMHQLRAGRAAFIRLSEKIDALLKQHADAATVRDTLGITKPFHLGPGNPKSQVQSPKSPPSTSASAIYREPISGVSVRLDFDGDRKLTAVGYGGQIGPPGGVPPRWAWEPWVYQLGDWARRDVGLGGWIGPAPGGASGGWSVPLGIGPWLVLLIVTALVRGPAARGWTLLVLWTATLGGAMFLLLAVTYRVRLNLLWQGEQARWVWIMLGGATAVTLWQWLKPTRRDPLACPTCGYHLRGNTTGTCPECGEPIPDAIRQRLDAPPVESPSPRP